MKKIIVLVIASFFMKACIVNTYDGLLIHPPEVSFEKPNFRYVTTISGSSKAVYTGFYYRYSRNGTLNGIINEAKKNMYSKHNFKPNQIITNMTQDIVRTTSSKGWGRYELTVILSGDVYEFIDKNSPTSYLIEDKTSEVVSPTASINLPKKAGYSYFLKDGFIIYEDQIVLPENTEIVYKAKSSYYKAKVQKFKGNSKKCFIEAREKFDVVDSVFKKSEVARHSIPLNYIFGYKLDTPE